MDDEENGTVKLISRDGVDFEVPIAVAMMSEMAKRMMINDEGDYDGVTEIPLPNVKATVLEKVIEYCTHYTTEEAMTPIETPQKASKTEEVVQKWYANFVQVEQVLLFELVQAADYMEIQPLLRLTCFAVAVAIKGKPPEEMREIFDLGPPPKEVEGAAQQDN